MFSSDELVFSQNPKTKEITAAGYNISSALMRSNCPALITISNKKKVTSAIPAGLVMIKEAGSNLIENNTNYSNSNAAGVNEVVSNDVYEQLLKSMYPSSDPHKQTKSSKSSKSRKSRKPRKSKKSKKSRKNIKKK